ncbi:hypothetical protein GGR57DRAFT_478310 [Xylariaceae sp. FL1272]|nr:hypothetical protein GGR57DRAFT_478310 [Xylariaceae sp. FL1272]
MEFISLLLHAAIRDSAVATELHRLRAEKTQNPDTWRPIIPVAVGDPHPATPQSPHNQFASTATGQSVRYQRAPADHVVQPRHSSHPDVKMESPGDGRPPLDHSKVDPALTDFKPKQSDDTESREGPCDFTWVLDQAQHYLGWKEELDGPSGSSRASLGTTAAIEIQKLLKEMNAQMDKHENFANRVHILSVMREVIFTAVAADTPLGRECRAVSQTYDLSTLDHSPDYNMLGRPQAYDVCFLLAARKLTSEQRKKLQVLEGGKWMNELQQLVMQATQKDCYPLLEQTLVWIDAFH